MQLPLMLTISEIITKYGIPRQAIELAMHERRLNAYKLQKKTFYVKREELEKWIDSRLSNVPLLRSKDFLGKEKLEQSPVLKIKSVTPRPSNVTAKNV